MCALQLILFCLLTVGHSTDTFTINTENRIKVPILHTIGTDEVETPSSCSFLEFVGDDDHPEDIISHKPCTKEKTTQTLNNEEHEAINLEETSNETKSPSDQMEKLHKLRFNYAAEQCGAKVVETSGVKGADNILSGSFDSYMLSHCGKENWVVIELCEEIVIDSILLGNKEFFSSNFKEFMVYGSKRFPAVEWNEIGQFTAKNIKEMQAFDFVKKEVYKYLKLEFLSHYGHEFYCPVTVVKVYGYTLVEDLREQVELSQTKLQNFNKLINEAKKSRMKMNIEELPVFQELENDSDSLQILPTDFVSSEMTDLMESFLQELEHHPTGENGEEVPATTNIFADLASHVTSLEMRHSLLSGYLDQFRMICSRKFEHLSSKREEDFRSMLEAVGNSTAPLEKSIDDMKKVLHTISSLNAKYNWLKKQFLIEQEKQSYELILAACISVVITIITTVCIFCVVFESPPVRKPPPRLFRTFYMDPNIERSRLRNSSDPSLDLDVGRSPLRTNHVRKHSS